jgi:CHAT domain-containing protein/Tfp pilus assembly protein PilF
MKKFTTAFLSLIFFLSFSIASQTSFSQSEKNPANFQVPVSAQTVSEQESAAKNLSLQWNRSDLSRSIGLYVEAAENWKTLNNLPKAAFCLREAGRSNLILGEKQLAEEFFNQSLSLLDSSSETEEKSRLFSELSLLALEKGDLKKCRNHFEQALKLARQTANPSVLAAAFYGAGIYYNYRSEFEKAIEAFKKSIEFWKLADDDSGEAKSLLELGYVLLVKNDYNLALEAMNSSYVKSTETNNLRGQALALKAAGIVCSMSNENRKAMDYYRKAESLFPDDIDYFEKAALLNGIGYVYENYGEWQLSFNNREKAIRLFQKDNNLYAQLPTLANLGKLSYLLGNNDKALDYLTETKILAARLDDELFAAIAEEELGNLFLKNGEYPTALNSFQKSLGLFQNKVHQRQIARVYQKLGQTYQKLGDFTIARQFFEDSLKLNHKVKDKFAESETIFDLAKLDMLTGNDKNALLYVKNSIEITEIVSSDVLNSKLNSTYFSNVFDRYELYINLLMKMHRQFPEQDFEFQALQAAEKSRTRTMMETLTLSEADFNKDANPETVKKEKEIRNLLNAKADRLTDALSRNADKTEIQTLTDEIGGFENQLEQIKADFKQNSPIYSAIKNPAPFDVGEFQRDVLDENSLLLEFSFGKEESYLWLVSKTEVNSYVLPPREQIESRIERLRKLIDSRGMLEGETVESYQARIGEAENTYKLESKQLSDELFGQVGDKLSDKRLIIVPDGKLHYFPVAALPFPNSTDNQPILLTNEVIYEPSAATLALLMRNGRKTSAATKNLLVFSDPIFSNQDARIANTANANEIQPVDNSLKVEKFRFAESLTSLARLNASRDEADSIVEIVGAADSTTLSGVAATRERALDDSISDYKIVHFATHGLIKEDRPELSGIVLSQVDQNGQDRNGVVRLQDIYAMNLTADAVVLSACSTGIGKEVKGEGLMSLNNAFLQTGAKSVVSSLWKVDDYAAQELMKNFYRELATGNVTTSEALRRAQINLRQNPQYQSPFYWAAFTIQGDFKTIPQLSKPFDYRIFGLLIFPLALLGFYAYRRRLN